MSTGQKIFITIIAIFALGLFFISFLPEVNPNTPQEQSSFATSTNSTSSPQGATSSRQTSEDSSKYVRAERMSSGKRTVQPVLSNLTIPVSLKVRGKVYITDVPKGSTVIDAMKSIMSSSDFRFHATYYAGMGYFVDEINGIKSDSEAFWIYYVNGVQANVGISSYILKPEDLILWRLEDSNKNEYVN